ncbi:MAG TPA: RNA-binding cell elongation regulator Jag/EloR [Candidatus Acidoferrales bacterium]|nr:RNA-binding cell elongation regulator Jag/EloR [Candidatus Acidoferrales bacterium]
MDFVEAEGDTIDEAIDNALKVLRVERERVTVDILEEGSRGFLGIGSKKARVRASLRKAVMLEEGEEADEQGAAKEPLSEDQKAALGEKGRAVLAEILRLMGLEATVETQKGEAADEIVLNVRGPYGGLLIGRRGQTLQALQYVVGRIVAKQEKGAGIRFVVDTEQYRERHRKKLEDTALRLGETAKRERRTIALDNLSARDRRIIHLTLEDDPWLTTRSQGQGPYRRLLIIPQGDRRKKEEENAAPGPTVAKPEK